MALSSIDARLRQTRGRLPPRRPTDHRPCPRAAETLVTESTRAPHATRAATPSPAIPTSPPPRDAIDEAIDARRTAEAVLYEIRRVIVGQDEMLERVLVALLAGGHLLLEG